MSYLFLFGSCRCVRWGQHFSPPPPFFFLRVCCLRGVWHCGPVCCCCCFLSFLAVAAAVCACFGSDSCGRHKSMTGGSLAPHAIPLLIFLLSLRM
ncbi:hypothetical protein TRSC58_07614 [Trypanosoma rangeli SC58]|uniref:Uncharacterized protein n=1 Tax=Trypanosoma rangeli SC58 TaxID=429131 RepID=A0A061ISI4_TRYRA|nr:hypothetical protein TRSC58_07614 [Trypanosoma rangeli SC58]